MNIFEKFTKNGSTIPLPFIKLREKSTDREKIWDETDRADIVSFDNYGTVDGQILIKFANARLGLDPFLWEIGSIIRIPYPYNSSIADLESQIDNYFKKYQR